MNSSTLSDIIAQSFSANERFRNRWDPFEESPEVALDEAAAGTILERLEKKLMENYPFHHPRYAGQMLKPPHPIAMAAYMMAMQINPNNHALDGGPATAKMEFEVVAKIAAMFGYSTHLGHLTSSGTIANLEALWIARMIHPNKAIAFSKEAHYTHKRMCEVIGARYIVLDSFEDLETAIDRHSIGTIVVTMGTTSTGIVEPLHNVISIAHAHGVRIHADAAYGGFFTILSKSQHPIIDPAPFTALKNADSIVIDPHKHGLQPYGCGCILFKDPSVGKYYKHDSPYTYFTSRDLHLGEISLECSRPGAAAAALWATLEYFPLELDKGFGPILTKTRSAALAFSSLLADSTMLSEFVTPDLDIVTYFPVPPIFSSSEVSAVSVRIFEEGMKRKQNPVYLATLTVESSRIKKMKSSFIIDTPTTTILRSVLMKPEHMDFTSDLFRELELLIKNGR